MDLGLFRNFLCCYRTTTVASEETYHENSLLIPHTIEPQPAPVIYTHGPEYDYQKTRERLGNIVRAKEGKMVNVTAQIPFDLHNRVFPVEASAHSRSRSASESREHEHAYHPSDTYFDVYSNQDSARRRKRHPFVSHDHQSEYSDQGVGSTLGWGEAGPSTYTRSRSPTTLQPRPTPILNLRLVHIPDLKARGRAQERGLDSSNVPSSTDPTGHGSTSLSSESPQRDKTQQSAANEVQFFDIGPIIINWGD